MSAYSSGSSGRTSVIEEIANRPEERPTTSSPQPDQECQQSLILKLRKPKSKKKVNWTEDTVDNEFMDKKKSKCCCVYHKPRQFDESSSEDSDDECEHCQGHVEAKKVKHVEEDGGDSSDRLEEPETVVPPPGVESVAPSSVEPVTTSSVEPIAPSSVEPELSTSLEPVLPSSEESLKQDNGDKLKITAESNGSKVDEHAIEKPPVGNS